MEAINKRFDCIKNHPGKDIRILRVRVFAITKKFFDGRNGETAE